MKQKISKMLKGGVLVLMFLGISCSVEEPQDSNLENNAKYSKKWITLPELSTVAGATENLARISANSAKISGREIYDNANDFTIHTDEMLLIEGEGLQTITFSVSRNYEEKNLENLIMVRDSNGKFSAYLASYAFDDADLEIIRNEGVPADTPQKTMVSSLESFVSPFGKEGNNDVPMCVYIDHIWMQGNILMYNTIIKPCNGEGGSGSGGGGGNNSGGVGPGTPNVPSNPPGAGNDNPPSPSTPNTGNLPGQQGGGGGNSGGGAVVTSPVTMTPAQALTARKKAFSQRLRSESLQLAFNALPANVQSELWNFLESSLTNGELTVIVSEYPATAIEFAVQATNALTEGGEIDFDSRIIKKNSFVENDCLNSTYEEFNNSSTSFNYFVNQFDSEFSMVDLSLSAGTFLTSNPPNALTTVLNNNLIEIKFNTSALNRPKLSIARTMIHEFIHALIYRRLLEISSIEGEVLLSLSHAEVIEMKDRFAELWINYNRYQLGIPQNGVISDFQHQFMADKYRAVMETALRQYDNNAHSQSFYEALAWEGLMGGGPNETMNYQTGLYPNSTVKWIETPQATRLAILNTILTFNNSNPSNPCN